ncbi:MAG: hypothetical protein RL518_2252 [Pseudomonadota bacterium]|jgi:hypothetical protein
MNDFIFVFLDDGTLDVVSSASNINGAYEGIDVEEGRYAFFNSKLHELTPKFTTANKNSGIFGLSLVSSGAYQLEDSEGGSSDFMGRLKLVSRVNSNSWFATISQIEDYARSLGIA